MPDVPPSWDAFRQRHALEPNHPAAVDLDAFRASLVEVLTRFQPADEVARRFALSPEYQAFVENVLDRNWSDADDWLTVHAAEVVAFVTEDDAVYLGDGDPETAELWVAFGHWSDRHDLFVCCDRTSPRFGYVADFHDGHPWLGTGGERVWPSLEAFFAAFGAPKG
jgi:hypothetical protein